MKLDDMMECSCGVCRHCLRQQLKDLRESYSPKTYADGWRECREAAAGYHEALALICDEKAEDYNIESAKNKDRAGRKSVV